MSDTDQSNVPEELSHRVHRLEVLLRISRMMNATANQETLIASITREVGDYVQADRCTVFFHDGLTNELYSHIATGLDQGQEIRLAVDGGVAGHVFQTGEVKNIQDVDADPLFTGRADQATGYRTRNLLTFPLQNRRGVRIGVFQVINKTTDPGYFDEEDEAFLAELVEQIADLLDLILRKDELAHRNAILEAQMQKLSSFEYLVDDRTAINMAFKYNRKLHYWGGAVGLALLLLMSVTSLVMVRSDGLRKLMVELHIGTAFGLGHRYYFYTDVVATLTLLVCLSGFLMYVYPPLNRWLKAKKNALVEERLAEGLREAENEDPQP